MPITAAWAEHSRFVQRIRRRYVAELPLLPAGTPGQDEITALVQRLDAVRSTIRAHAAAIEREWADHGDDILQLAASTLGLDDVRVTAERETWPSLRAWVRPLSRPRGTATLPPPQPSLWASRPSITR